MGFFNKYPYTDDHELNLDWIIAKINALKDRVKAVEDAIHDIVVVTPNDGKLTIKRNNTIIGDFTANQATDEDINILVPENTSDLNNDSGFITLSDIPAQVQSNWNEADNTNPAYIQNKPTIPAAQVNSDWNANSGVAQILNRPTLATVATSGNYNDLSNKPTIPVGSDYVQKSGDTMTGRLIISANGMRVKGRAYGAGDDEGIVVEKDNNGYAGVCLGNPSGIRSVFYLTDLDKPVWRFNTGANSYDIQHPAKSGTVATVHNVTTTSNWTYYKDDDGYYHMFGKWLNVSLNLTTSYGSMYYQTDYASFPVTISNYIYADVQCIINNALIYTNIHSITSSRIDWFVSSPTSGNKTIQVVMVYVIGK